MRNWRQHLLVMLTLLLPMAARAHVGSPDVFFQGQIGPWPARITIRMPGVVPGQAEIQAQIESTELPPRRRRRRCRWLGRMDYIRENYG